jgi:hypothetical protein
VLELKGGDAEKADLLLNLQNLDGLRVTSFRTVGTGLENLYMSMISDSV